MAALTLEDCRAALSGLGAGDYALQILDSDGTGRQVLPFQLTPGSVTELQVSRRPVSLLATLRYNGLPWAGAAVTLMALDGTTILRTETDDGGTVAAEIPWPTLVAIQVRNKLLPPRFGWHRVVTITDESGDIVVDVVGALVLPIVQGDTWDSLFISSRGQVVRIPAPPLQGDLPAQFPIPLGNYTVWATGAGGTVSEVRSLSADQLGLVYPLYFLVSANRAILDVYDGQERYADALVTGAGISVRPGPDGRYRLDRVPDGGEVLVRARARAPLRIVVNRDDVRSVLLKTGGQLELRILGSLGRAQGAILLQQDEDECAIPLEAFEQTAMKPGPERETRYRLDNVAVGSRLTWWYGGIRRETSVVDAIAVLKIDDLY